MLRQVGKRTSPTFFPHAFRNSSRAYQTVRSGGKLSVIPPKNEPIKEYRKGSPERAALISAIDKLKSDPIDVPAFIGGKEIRTGDTSNILCPHSLDTNIGQYHNVTEEHMQEAVDASLAAQKDWWGLPVEERLAVFMKAAELLRGPYRPIVNAATILGQSKTWFQAEIDSACELIDFFAFNVHFAQEIYEEQPISPDSGVWNRTEWRPLEGFVYAASPFNFTAIGGNLCTSPALMGNTCVWKPSSNSILSNYVVYRCLEEAGLPPGVINFIPGDASKITQVCLNSPHLAGVHYTGSTAVFNSMWETIGSNISKYRNFPRIVGETGGKDFVFAHPSADVPSLVTALVRGAFEYCGQKCSAASRAYIPASLWDSVKEGVQAQLGEWSVGSPEDPATAMGAVIHHRAFKNITQRYIDHARENPSTHTFVSGGDYDDSKGLFIQPTVVQVTDLNSRLMREEIFGPVLTVYVYEDEKFEETLGLCDTGSPYALTGCIFARDRRDIHHMTEALAYAAGNFYVNDKPTGAVVGQQPFGGQRLSGTNDKAGSKWNLLRWTGSRSIKETFVPPTHFAYPYMNE